MRLVVLEQIVQPVHWRRDVLVMFAVLIVTAAVILLGTILCVLARRALDEFVERSRTRRDQPGPGPVGTAGGVS